MNTEQTAQQLELAAQIIRTGHPWERELSTGKWGKTDSSPLTMIAGGLKIRLALATPPDGRPLHNLDNLTAEQVGAGYRLVCYDDSTREEKLEKWMDGEWVVVYCPISQMSFRDCSGTYRLPLSALWPEPQPDPYAELKKAHAEGKVIQGCIRGHWIDCPHPTWKYPVDSYRKKPDEKKTVPLGPEDVPPGSVFRPVGWSSIPNAHVNYEAVITNGVRTIGKDWGEFCSEYGYLPWLELQSEWQINRSIPLTGKWNPDAWEPCSKETDA